MQRKATKTTRTANQAEKDYLKWVKAQGCVICDNWPVIADHCRGATYRAGKVLVGMWFVLPYCMECDMVKTQGSHRAHLLEFGATQEELWLEFIKRYADTPAEVIEAIKSTVN